jgi:branched-chain amino acid transport system substrate-binding protein
MRSRVMMVVMVMALVMLMMNCHRDSSTKPSSTKPIKIGSVLSLTGDLAEYGTRCKEGIDLAVDEINAAGGINGRPFEVIYEDDKGIPTEGVTALNKLISFDGVSTVTGAVSSSVTLAMEPIATREHVFLFSPVSSSPKIPGKSKYLYSMWPPDTFEARALAEFASQKLGKKRAAVLYVDNEYGLGLMDQFAKRASELGMQIVAKEAYPLNNKDFRLIIPKVKQSQPEVIFLAGYHKEMAFATKEIRESGMTQQILGNTDYEVQELLDIAGQTAEGAVYATPRYDPNVQGTPMERFASKFRAKYHKEPSLFQANSYDLIQLVVAGFKAKGVSGDSLAAFIPTVRDYDGASGLTSFVENGEVVKGITIRTVQNGKFTEWKGAGN